MPSKMKTSELNFDTEFLFKKEEKNPFKNEILTTLHEIKQSPKVEKQEENLVEENENNIKEI